MGVAILKHVEQPGGGWFLSNRRRPLIVGAFGVQPHSIRYATPADLAMARKLNLSVPDGRLATPAELVRWANAANGKPAGSTAGRELRLYRLDYWHRDRGRLVIWHTCKEEAGKQFRQMLRARPEPAKPWEGVRIAMLPITKHPLTAWLNKHFYSDNG